MSRNANDYFTTTVLMEFMRVSVINFADSPSLLIGNLHLQRTRSKFGKVFKMSQKVALLVQVRYQDKDSNTQPFFVQTSQPLSEESKASVKIISTD